MAVMVLATDRIRIYPGAADRVRICLGGRVTEFTDMIHVMRRKGKK